MIFSLCAGSFEKLHISRTGLRNSKPFNEVQRDHKTFDWEVMVVYSARNRQEILFSSQNPRSLPFRICEGVDQF